MPRVVIVDDDSDIRELLLDKVTLAGYHAVGTATADAALDALRKEPADVIVADVAMPGVSGLELCEIIRADHDLCHLAIVLVSARAQDHDKAAGLAAGADIYLIKPFSPRELLERIEDALALRRG